MDKRGLSEVIITVLIILIAIASVFLIWQFLKPSLKENAGSINLDKIRVDLEITRNSLIRSEINNSFSIKITRNAGEGDLTKIKIIVENETAYGIYEFEGIPELGESQLNVPNTVANYAKIRVVPIVKVGNNLGDAGIADILVIRDVQTVTIPSLNTCSALGGSICSGSICSVATTASSDGNCCVGGTCQTPCTNLCSQLGLVNNTCFNSTRIQNRTCQMYGSCLNWTLPVYSDCPSGKSCSNGNCICSLTTCSALGKTCGNWSNGCGGTLNCGSCTSGQNCNATGQCSSQTVCESLGYSCKNSCDSNEEQNSSQCNTGKVCCKKIYDSKYLDFTEFPQFTTSSKSISVDVDNSGNIYIAFINSSYGGMMPGNMQNSIIVIKLNKSLDSIKLVSIPSYINASFSSPIKIKWNNNQIHIVASQSQGYMMGPYSSSSSWNYLILNENLSLISNTNKGSGIVFGLDFDITTPVFGVYTSSYSSTPYYTKVSVIKNSAEILSTYKTDPDYISYANIYVKNGKAYLAAWNYYESSSNVAIHLSKEGSFSDKVYNTEQSSDGYDAVEDLLVDNSGNIYVAYYAHHPYMIAKFNSSGDFIASEYGNGGPYAMINTFIESNDANQIFVGGEEYGYNYAFAASGINKYNSNNLSNMIYTSISGAAMRFDKTNKRLIAVDDDHLGSHSLRIMAYYDVY